jgi:hypothetical protein
VGSAGPKRVVGFSAVRTVLVGQVPSPTEKERYPVCATYLVLLGADADLGGRPGFEGQLSA